MTGLTSKSTQQVVLEPLDGSGRIFILYGLKTEDVSFRVQAPTKRTVSRSFVTQQRAVDRRRYSIQIAIFEPPREDDFGRQTRLGQSGIFEGNTGTPKLTAKDQIELVHTLAKMHEEGVLFRYSGLAHEVPRCAITEFTAQTLYAYGTGTLALEERPEAAIDFININLDAIQAAERDLARTEPVAANAEDFRDAITTNNFSSSQWRNLVSAFIAKNVKSGFLKGGLAGPILQPTNDSAVLGQFGIRTVPLPVDDVANVKQLYPSDPSGAIPSMHIIPLEKGYEEDKRAAASLALRHNPFNERDFSFITAFAGLFIWAKFRQHFWDGKWECDVEVYDSLVPPTVDVQQDTAGQYQPAGQAPAARAEPRVTKATPYKTAKIKVSPGLETEIARDITVSFLYEGGKMVLKDGGLFGKSQATKLKNFAFVIADYRA